MHAPSNAITGGFRNTTADPLVTANIRAGGGQADNGAIGYIDDVYLASGMNLTNPALVPELKSAVLLLTALMMFGWHRRSRKN